MHLESGIPLTIRIRNPSSTEKDLESSNWNPESTAWIPESKSVLDSLTRGEMKLEKATSIFVPMAVPCVWSSFFHKTGMDASLPMRSIHDQLLGYVLSMNYSMPEYAELWPVSSEILEQ